MIRHTNIPDDFILYQPCKWSFSDLIHWSGKNIDLSWLYSISQDERNLKVKELCIHCNWYFCDIYKENGVIYTAFSPNITRK